MLTVDQIRHARAAMGDHLAALECLVQAVDRGCPTYTAAVIERTCNAAASALQTLVIDIDAIRDEGRRRVAARDPRNWPVASRRSRDADLPAVGSFGSAA